MRKLYFFMLLLLSGCASTWEEVRAKEQERLDQIYWVNCVAYPEAYCSLEERERLLNNVR